MTPEEKSNWCKLSPKNREITRKVLGVILDFLELHPINELIPYIEIPLRKFRSKQIDLDDIKGVLSKIDGIKIKNDGYDYQPCLLFNHLPSKKELEKYIFLEIDSLDELKKIKNLIDRQLKTNIKAGEILKSKIRLKSKEIKYDDNETTLYIGTQKCPLPPYKNEHYLCRAMYEYKANEPVDWSEIYEKMTGFYEAYYGKPPATRQNWRIVYDAMEALNKRVEKVANTDDELFTWQEKTIKRNY